jgi:hypothetical protein
MRLAADERLAKHGPGHWSTHDGQYGQLIPARTTAHFHKYGIA